jgi:RNA polymerase sigma-70 factor (ECF subfamily)
VVTDSVEPATSVLSEELRRELRRFVARRVDDEETAEDLVQEIMLRIFHRIGSVRARERLDAWMYQTARNAIVDYYRRSARRELSAGSAAELEPALPAHSEPDPDNDAEREIARCLKPLLGRLTPGYRQAVELVEFDRLPQRIAAERLGVSVSGLKSRVQRARQQLKAMLTDCCAIELDSRRHVHGYQPRETGCGCDRC